MRALVQVLLALGEMKECWMTPLERGLSSIVELAQTNDPKGLVFIDRCVDAHLASPERPTGVAHPGADLAEALMKTAPGTEFKGHIPDRLFQVDADGRSTG